QLEPHFLFNALGGIVALIRTDPQRATAMAYELSEMLRRTVAGLRAAESTLAEEIEYGRSYLALQAMRFDGLEFEFRASPEVLDTAVPALFLQPLLENAVTHGIARRGGRGRITVTAGPLDGGRLLVDVTDSGATEDAADPPRPGTGTGLDNVLRRLELFLGRPARLEVVRGAGETSVRLALPPRRGGGR
ncbi:MAG TPA: histidine kinase, partial [Longimicrobium sp.]